MSKKDKEILEA